MRFETARICRIGGRESNQDYSDFVVYKKKKLGCWALADGLGGHKGGEIASKLAVDAIIKAFKKDPQCTGEALYRYLEIANQEILLHQQQNPRLSRMRTTLALLVTDFKHVLWAHIGDTRIYHFRRGKIRFQTRDHSVSQARATEGEIPQDQVRHHKERNQLLKTMGQQETFRPQIHREKILLRRSDAFLLCTDGFWEYLEEKEMEFAYSNAAIPRKWLLDMEKNLLKKAKKKLDNYSAIGVYFLPGIKK